MVTNVNIRVLGKYTATFTAIDWRGKTKSVTKEIEVVDNVAPVLNKTDEFLTVNVDGTQVSLPKFTATDNYWENLNVVIEKYNYNYNRYTDDPWYNPFYTDIYLESVIYSVVDGSGNKTRVTYTLPEKIFIKTVHKWVF